MDGRMEGAGQTDRSAGTDGQRGWDGRTDGAAGTDGQTAGFGRRDGGAARGGKGRTPESWCASGRRKRSPQGGWTGTWCPRPPPPPPRLSVPCAGGSGLARPGLLPGTGICFRGFPRWGGPCPSERLCPRSPRPPPAAPARRSSPPAPRRCWEGPAKGLFWAGGGGPWLLPPQGNPLGAQPCAAEPGSCTQGRPGRSPKRRCLPCAGRPGHRVGRGEAGTVLPPPRQPGG